MSPIFLFFTSFLDWFIEGGFRISWSVAAFVVVVAALALIPLATRWEDDRRAARRFKNGLTTTTGSLIFYPTPLLISHKIGYNHFGKSLLYLIRVGRSRLFY